MSRVLAPLLPRSAPFSAAERAWIDGYLAGLLGLLEGAPPDPAPATGSPPAAAAPARETESFPWHDPSLPLDERLALAEGRPLRRVLMAAMAQTDCGQCGYLCQTYAEAVADGREASLTRCVPGGKETARALKELMAAPAPSVAAGPRPAAGPVAARQESRAAARFERATKLTGEASQKDTRHVVLQLDAPLDFRVGDSLGIRALNDDELADAIIARLGVRPGSEVDCPDGTRRPLREALIEICDIGRPSDEVIEVLASRASDAGEAEKLQALAEGYPGAEPADADLYDLLLAFPSARPPLQELVSALGPLQPRLYSIASSPKIVTDGIHLTVAAVRYQRHGRLRKGIASTFLAERARAGQAVPVFIQPAHAFALPAAGDTPIIMIGPGTGVAPFRAFLQERRAIGAGGANWLFFGDQRRAADFLYEEELTAYLEDGLLSRLDLAFSRDQTEKLYVQHRMRENAAELWQWIESGAHVYVCGDASRMARDVDQSLQRIVARQGGMDLAGAKAYLAALAQEGRYQRDVY